MFINNFDPVALNFLSLAIRWYSLSYIFLCNEKLIASACYLMSVDCKTIDNVGL